MSIVCLTVLFVSRTSPKDSIKFEYYSESGRTNLSRPDRLRYKKTVLALDLQNLPAGQILHLVCYIVTEFQQLLQNWKMERSSYMVKDEVTQEQIYKIRDLNRKFRLSCTQLTLINNLIEETEVRYNRS